ncbi:MULTISPECIES: MsnO8 family LLM class oxidoreductase [Kitasatospora]|uniref:Luciferase family oxidoreductase group 1 n=2 Tax=Kitasatospora TaxID=2063 RepID=A0ABT1J075_9ACTN|nr:MsnO8 family LLM class oxidoreductase [Kitasatospora paracochleata]MCP2310196.1 luciferase family oxidoreductase group 1 [Kitasatospora paracochleata]
MTLRLSVLDQSPIPAGAGPADALRASVDLAREADRLGYHRYWVAEHHHSPSFAGTAPEIMVATLLENTRRLRVGSGGVLLPRYPALKVAEVFRVLAALHPGRVDLGIGRAGGPAERFPEQVAELTRRLAEPAPGYREPELWLLGAGTGSAELAAGLPAARFAFAHFLRPELGPAALAAFRRGRAGHPRGPAGAGAALAVRVVVGESAAEADELATAFLLWRSRKDLGLDEPFPSRAATRAHRWSGAESSRALANGAALVAGTAEQVHAALTGLAELHGVSELVVNTLTHDPADRLRSYRLLAEAFGPADRGAGLRVAAG